MAAIERMIQKIFVNQLYLKITCTALFVMFFLAGQDDAARAQKENGQSKTYQEGGVVQTQVLYMTLHKKLADSYETEFYGGMRNHLHMGAGLVEFTPIPGLKNIAGSSPFYLPDERIALKGVDEICTLLALQVHGNGA